MPELPEVETVVRGLRDSLAGRRIVSVRLGKTDFIDDPAALERELPGLRIETISRRGKFIVLGLGNGAAVGEDGSSDSALLVHLGMTGNLSPRAAAEPLLPHTHVQLALDDGRELRYTDPRRFGRMAWLPATRLAEFGARLGAEPLAVNESEFAARLAGRRAMIKALLLDQHVFAGLGNIYADESLWRARVHPRRHASSLKPQQVCRLWREVRHVLQASLRAGGSSISDFRNADGQPGWYQLRHRVYQREGKACYRCRSKIRRVIVAGRSSHFCPQCQPRPRSR